MTVHKNRKAATGNVTYCSVYSKISYLYPPEKIESGTRLSQISSLLTL